MQDLPTKITREQVQAEIASEHIFTASHGVEGALANLELYQQHYDTDTTEDPAPVLGLALEQTTICVMVLRDSTRFVGVNFGPIDEGEFDAVVARTSARESAFSQAWTHLNGVLRAIHWGMKKMDYQLRLAKEGQSSGGAPTTDIGEEIAQVVESETAAGLDQITTFVSSTVYPSHSHQNDITVTEQIRLDGQLSAPTLLSHVWQLSAISRGAAMAHEITLLLDQRLMRTLVHAYVVDDESKDLVAKMLASHIRRVTGFLKDRGAKRPETRDEKYPQLFDFLVLLEATTFYQVGYQGAFADDSMRNNVHDLLHRTRKLLNPTATLLATTSERPSILLDTDDYPAQPTPAVSD